MGKRIGTGGGARGGLGGLPPGRGIPRVFANPTPVPDRFAFLMPSGADRSAHAARDVETADVIVVVDIADLSRLGDLAHAIRARGAPVACIDHHVSPGAL